MEKIANFKKMCAMIDDFEARHPREDKFSEYIELVRRFGARTRAAKRQLITRVENFCLLSDTSNKGVGREFVENMFTCLGLLDEEFGLNTLATWSGGRSIEEICGGEEELEARAEAVEFCAKMLYGDGLCETLSEAYELADMCLI